MNKVNTLTTNSAYNIKFQKVPNIRIDDSTLTKQKNIGIETSKKPNIIEGIKDSNITRQLCLNCISLVNEEILLFSLLLIHFSSSANREVCSTGTIFARDNSQNENQ
jgi:hypothetical protein